MDVAGAAGLAAACDGAAGGADTLRWRGAITEFGVWANSVVAFESHGASQGGRYHQSALADPITRTRVKAAVTIESGMIRDRRRSDRGSRPGPAAATA